MRVRLTSWPLLLLALACAKGQEHSSTSDRPATPIPAPEFGILSPTRGDTLVEGRTYTIRWVSVPPRRIDIGAVMGGHDKGFLLTAAPAGLDSLVWTVPVGFVTGFGPSSSDQIRLRLTNSDNENEWVETGPFVIRGALP